MSGWQGAAGFVLLGVLVRLACLGWLGGLDDQIHDSFGDQFIYLDIARNLVAGRGFVVSTDIWVAVPGQPTSIVPPLYPLWLASVFAVCGEHLLAVRVLQALLSASVSGMAFVLGRAMFNARTGLLAGLTVTVYPALVLFARPIMSEGLFYPLLAVLVWVTHAVDRNDGRSWTLQASWGIAAALAILARTEAGVLCAILLTHLVVSRCRRRGRFAMRHWWVALATTTMLLLPYGYYNYMSHGRFSVLPNARWKFWDHTWWAAYRHDPQWQGVVRPEKRLVPHWDSLSELERDRFLWGVAVDFVRSSPTTFLVQRVKRLAWSYPERPWNWFAPAPRPMVPRSARSRWTTSSAIPRPPSSCESGPFASFSRSRWQASS
jgi:4-amino-4-deoxy-L-arabinose transferase-like glycosyltransferase